MTEYDMEDGQVVGRINPLMSNDTYDKTKFVALIVLPAVAALYFAISQIWGLPYGEEVVGTLVALDTFLGVILRISSASYKNETEGPTIGFINVQRDEDKTLFSLEPAMDPMEIPDHDKVTFKVREV